MTPLELALRVTGLSLLVLAGLHTVFWRSFDWRGDSQRLTPLNGRVFLAHLLVVVFLLAALGLLLLFRAPLLLERTELARLLSAALVLFFALRLIAQPLLFDPVLLIGSRWRTPVRVLATSLWTAQVAVFAALLGHQLDWRWSGLGSHLTWLRVGVALVWLLFGLVFKALDLVPRHRMIVGRVLGERWATPVTLLVAVGESTLGLWMLSGHWLVPCVALQTAAIAAMNTLELKLARDLLVAPRAMVLANCALLAVSWYVALSGRPT
jgi:hypothetical protein